MAVFDLGTVQSWFDEQHGGDRVLAATRVMTPANVEVSELGVGGHGVGSTEPTRKLLGLDLENRSWLLTGKAGLLVLTATKFSVLRLGGFKEKIKETLFEAPRAQMQFTANDLTVGKLDWRHWLVTGFPDGRYLLEPQVMAKSGTPSKVAAGSNGFLAELGDQVQRLAGSAET